MTQTTDMALRTPAWLLLGLTGSAPGVLEMVDGRLAFTGEEGRVFDAPITAVREVVFPWYYFGGGVKLSVGETRYRLSFVRPNGASDIPGGLLAKAHLDGALGVAGDAVALLTAGRKIYDVGVGRQAGKAWKKALGAMSGG